MTDANLETLDEQFAEAMDFDISDVSDETPNDNNKTPSDEAPNNEYSTNDKSYNNKKDDSNCERTLKEETYHIIKKQNRIIDELKERIVELEERVDELEDQPTVEVEDETDPIKTVKINGQPLGGVIASKASKGMVERETEALREDIQSLDTASDDSASPEDSETQDESEQHEGERVTNLMEAYQNCQQHYVDKHIDSNKARAVEVVRRHDEFGQKSHWNDSVAFSRDDIRRGLTAILGRDPHGQTVTRVWNFIIELSGEDVQVAKKICGKTNGQKEKVLQFDKETLERYDRSIFESQEEETVFCSITPVVNSQATG